MSVSETEVRESLPRAVGSVEVERRERMEVGKRYRMAHLETQYHRLLTTSSEFLLEYWC